jgi:hypothetical protein
MVAKRKLAPGDQRDDRGPAAHAPVDISGVALAPPGAEGESTVLGLHAAAAALGSAKTTYEQLSVCQKLKARLVDAPAAEGAAELQGVLDFLLALYLSPASRPLRKTIVAVVAAAEARAQAQAQAKGGGGGPAGDNVAVAAANAAAARYFGAVFGSGSGWEAPGTLAGASGEVATFLACLDLPLLATPLLTNSSKTEDRVGGCLAVFAEILAVHQAPLALASGGGCDE